MPKAVANPTELQRFDLKTAPPDGFVELRRMSYGQIVQRRSLMKLRLAQANGNDFAGEMAMANKEINLFEFRACIANHNLDDGNGRLLNLSNQVDVESLDPRIGAEIEYRINEMNNFDADAEFQENLTDGAKQLSS